MITRRLQVCLMEKQPSGMLGGGFICYASIGGLSLSVVKEQTKISLKKIGYGLVKLEM